jgi:hypothetical protein
LCACALSSHVPGANSSTAFEPSADSLEGLVQLGDEGDTECNFTTRTYERQAVG